MPHSNADADAWKEIESILSLLPLTRNRREEIDGYGLVVGAVIDGRSKEVVVHSTTYEYQDELRRLFMLLQRLDVLKKDFACSSFQVLRDAAVKRHSDRNSGPSLVFATGNFEGGRLMTDAGPIDNFRRAQFLMARRAITLKSTRVPDGVEPFTNTLAQSS